jgi:serine/threonine-protein kinase
VLGESVRRRLGRRAASKTEPETAAGGPRWNRRHWLAVLLGLTLPFGVGYLLAVAVLFPPPEVVAQGVEVPELLGKTEDEAAEILGVLGFAGPTVSRLPSPSAEEGIVIAQSPLPGQQLRPGAAVRVAVSSGPPRVTVPDVLGFPIERAASLLTRLGFEVQRVEEPSYTEAGRVIRVEPPPGTERQLPTRVTLTISAALDTMLIDTTKSDTVSDTTLVRHSARFGWSAPRSATIFAARESVNAARSRAMR